MKKLITLLMLALVASTYAQNKAFVAVGGKFEFGVTEFQDRATLGVVDIYTNTYTLLATIEAESVQKVGLSSDQGGDIYVAAQDSIVAFSYFAASNAATRLGSVAFSGIKTLEVTQNHVIAGKWFGAGDYLVVYNRSDLSQAFVTDNPDLSTEVRDIQSLGDGYVAVSYNIKGKVCGPFSCPDSLGRVDVIDLQNEVTLKTIDLGSAGRGNITLCQGPNGTDFLAVSSSNQLITYVDAAWEIVADTLNSGVSTVFQPKSLDGLEGIHAQKSDGTLSLVSFDETTNQFTFEQDGTELGAKPVWAAGFGVNKITTDFDTFGTVEVFGNEPIEVGVSPEDMAFGEYVITGVANQTQVEYSKFTLLAHQIAAIELSEGVLMNLSGLEVLAFGKAADFNSNDLPAGVYVLRGQNARNQLVSYKVVQH